MSVFIFKANTILRTLSIRHLLHVSAVSGLRQVDFTTYIKKNTEAEANPYTEYQSKLMYFNVLTVKGRPQPRYNFPCMLWNLPDDGQKWTKHAAGDKRMHSDLRSVFVQKIQSLCLITFALTTNFIFDTYCCLCDLVIFCFTAFWGTVRALGTSSWSKGQNDVFFVMLTT
jgi:hypothetical protein